jgi:hypothetical protein
LRPLHEEEVPVERHGYMTNLLGDRAVQTIERYARAKEPFLLSLHFTAPHWPFEGPDDEAESNRLRDIGSIRVRDNGTQATYARMVQNLDAAVSPKKSLVKIGEPSHTRDLPLSPRTD